MYSRREKQMADPTLEKIRSEALRLPESERAELAHSLVLSLDGPADADAEGAWETEIRRRLDEIEAGTAELIDREELRRRMQARMSRA
jgi:putative addiction module component (TIGR02574 family)